MSQITQLPGAVDFLQRGLVAGQKMKALESEYQARTLQNALAAGDLAHQETRQGLQDALAEKQLELAESTIDFREKQKEDLESIMTARAAATAQREAAGARDSRRIDIGEAQFGRESDRRDKRLGLEQQGLDLQDKRLDLQADQETMRMLMEGVRSAGDPTPTREESRAFVVEGFEAQGIKPSPAQIEWFTNIHLNRSQKLLSDINIAKRESEGLLAQQGANTALLIERENQIKIDAFEDVHKEEYIKASEEAREFESLLAAAKTKLKTAHKKDKPKQQALIDGYEDALRALKDTAQESYQKLQDLRSGQPTAPTLKTNKEGLPVVNTDAEYEQLPSGTEFVDSNGERFRKP